MNFGWAGALTFLNPWVLAGLIFLPVLWYLLRVTPPAPRRIPFPAYRFLEGLIASDQTASRTPWWILLMRLLALALIIVALARPVLNAGERLSGHGPMRLVIDNGWGSARNWQQMTATATDLLDQASRNNRPLYIMTTAPEPGPAAPVVQGPLATGEAQALLRGLKPLPWPADYTAAANALDKAHRPVESVHSVWLSHGARDGGASKLMSLLQNQGALTLYRPDPAAWPLLLRPVVKPGTDIEAYVDAVPGTANGVPFVLEALGSQGKVIDVKEARLDTASLPDKIKFTIPEPLNGQISRMVLAGPSGAGGVLLFDDQGERKSVGIVSPGKNAQATPLVDADFYLNRALAPYADLHSGTLADLLKLKPSVIILPDIGAMPSDVLNALEDWVKSGGLLLRFAGPNMSQTEAFLTPVPLRGGGRALNGAMTWEKPQHIAPFPKNSPFNGMAIPADLTVKQQILAEPVDGMDKKTWAALTDGTPLITADELGRGMLVMVHTTATPAWSDLALSGLFVQILRRTVAMAGLSVRPSDSSGSALQPIAVLDGFGALIAPDASVEPIAADKIELQQVDSKHPPGLYGRPGVSHALNLGTDLPPLSGFDDLPSGVDDVTFGKIHQRDLMPALLIAAVLVFFADWLTMIVLQAGWHRRLLQMAAIALIVALLPLSSQAQNADASAVKYAGAIYLAYVRSGNSVTDATTQSGLEALKDVLNRRTSVEPAGVVAVDPEHDDLSFFPLIYWPVIDSAPPLSAQALGNVQSYLDHGGTILFDTGDQASGTSAGRNGAALQRIAGALNIPPLVVMPKDHVLTKSFYLLHSMPGRYDGGVIWVQDQSASGRDGVSSVIVGSNDWASAWAGTGNDEQSEMALRFGVNLMLYALTGNYKADQVHLQGILERLGQ